MKRKKIIYFLFLVGVLFLRNSVFSQWNPNYSIGTQTGNYVFSYNQTPAQLVEIYPPLLGGSGSLSYQWESSTAPLTGFAPISGATQSSYTFSAPLQQTTYFRRKVTDNQSNSVYSNIIKIQVASVNWENINYVREHDVITTNITDWKTVDQQSIGQKLQTTTYLDGLGRPLEKVSRETATPPSGNNLWGDMVQFSVYDNYGREPKQYLPYTTTTQSGKYKVAPLTDQPQYYSTVYNETAAYSNISFDNSPLNRVTNVKSPGTSWKNSAGNSAIYDLNAANDNVQIFTIGYNIGAIPVDIGAYAAKTLFKTIEIDENGNQVIQYTNQSGQLILKKVQIDNNPSPAHNGWICTYNVYDDFGLLRYVLQPEAVKYLDANGWSFAGANGQQILNEYCFRYEYDDKGRCILKKAPGAQPLQMLYDSRDRVVFMQDGNQAAKSPPQWTANLYDELDRVTVTTLYNTTKTVANLQTDINNSVTVTTVTITNSGQPIVDLLVDNRNTSITTYTARNSITFASDAGGSFASATNDNFVAQIDPNAATPPITATVAVFKNPITTADLNNSSVTTILKYQFYDDYSFTGAKPFDNSFDNYSAYNNSDPNVIPIASSKRTLSFPTGSMVRVLNTNTFLSSTEYYDEKGRHIQTTEDNIKQGKDLTTLQYHFDGRLLSSNTKHSTAYSGYTNFSILTKNIFDKIGRITSIQKRYGTNNFKTIASYDYDDVGRLQTKHLDPVYTGSGKNELESLVYTYNIHNEITGINKDYALKTAANYDKWATFFGLYIGYDNRDNVFDAAQLDGHVTGLLWNTQGDDAQRKYDYSYDNAGRLINAVFKERQQKNDAWDNSKIDFSVTGSSGQITYDLNGNLLTMLQKGVIPGSSAPVQIDNLNYTYTQYSNKLSRVQDNTPQKAINGQSGDFKDGTNVAGTNDYVYDDNGNVVIDLNKNIKDLGGVTGDGISYNFLDKPDQIRIRGKGTIKIVYDAEGNKLQKIYTPENSSVSTTTTYINEFVYRGDTLQYINFEEGRIRVMQPVSQSNGYDALIIDGNMSLPNGKEGVYDYFIRDYQQNVRMILSEELHEGSNQCTMETARASAEEPIFGQQGSGNEVVKTRFPKPVAWQANNSLQVSKLGDAASGAASQTGPNVLLKVMAGDTINAAAIYYYKNNVTNTNGSQGLTQNVLNALIQAITGSSGTGSLVKGGTAGISLQLNYSLPFANLTEPDANNPNGIKPKAYITILFFDERFNFVSDGSTFLRVSQRGDGASPLVLASIKAPKNGYAYVYLSNESDEPVYFDNLQVGLNRGKIIEEDHYYSFGLKIAAISSQKLGDPNEGFLENKNLYNDKELFDDADLDWYDYGFRNYDAQIGRFTQLDPLTDDYPELTPYQYASDEPIANIDLDGLEGELSNIANGFTDVGRTLSEVTVTSSAATKVLTPVTVSAKIAKNLPTAFNIASLAIKTLQVGANIGNRISQNWEIMQWNYSMRWNNFKEGAANRWSNIKAAIHNKAANERVPVWQAAVEQSLGFSPNEPAFSMLGGEGEGGEILFKESEQLMGREVGSIGNKWIDEVGQIKWPKNDGFETTPTKTTLQKGATFDRYGGTDGYFGSPAGTSATERSLAPGTTTKPLTKYRVLKPIEVKSGKTTPWFGEKGGGLQYKFDKTIQELKDGGYIEKL